MPRCRDCKLYDLEKVKNARGAVLSNRVAKCLWKSTEVYPISVRPTTFRPEGALMHPNENHRCQRFVTRNGL